MKPLSKKLLLLACVASLLLLMLFITSCTGRHTHIEDTVAGIEATCQSTGLTEGKRCLVCGDVLLEQKEIARLEHSLETVKGDPPTCTQSGYTSIVRCEMCYEIFTEAISIPPRDHVSEIIPAIEPTCTEMGWSEGEKCKRCGEILVPQYPVSTMGHKEVFILGKEPTCTETGLTDGWWCEVCGEVFVYQEEIPQLDHEEKYLPAKEATCTQSGLTEGYCCASCGEIMIEQEYIPPTYIHTYDESGFCIYCGVSQNKISEGLIYYLDSAGQFYRVGGIGTCNDTEIYIPSTYLGLPVKEITSSAFINNDRITKVVIPYGVRNIGTRAFYNCTSLEAIEIPSSVTSISSSFVRGCKSLVSIEVHEDNAEYKSVNGDLYSKDGKTLVQYAIGKNQFSFAISTEVTKIENYAFYGSENLKNVYIPSSVETIGLSSFRTSKIEYFYCEVASKPKGWSGGWNQSAYVYWGYPM